MVEPCPDFVPPIIALVGILFISAFFLLVIGLFRQRRWIELKNSMNRLIVAFNPDSMTFATFTTKAGLNTSNGQRMPQDALEYAILSLSEGSIKKD